MNYQEARLFLDGKATPWWGLEADRDGILTWILKRPLSIQVGQPIDIDVDVDELRFSMKQVVVSRKANLIRTRRRFGATL